MPAFKLCLLFVLCWIEPSANHWSFPLHGLDTTCVPRFPLESRTLGAVLQKGFLSDNKYLSLRIQPVRSQLVRYHRWMKSRKVSKRGTSEKPKQEHHSGVQECGFIVASDDP